MSHFLTNLMRHRAVFLLFLWLIAIAVMSLLSPYFLELRTAAYLLQFVPVLGLLGAGQTLIMLAGGPGIDLSIGANLSLSGIFMAFLVTLGVNVWVAALLCLMFAGLLGLVNGFLINYIGIPALMATLATLFVYGGLALALTNGIPISGFPSSFAFLGQGQILGLPAQFVLVFIPAMILLHFVLSRTVWGKHIYATGNNEHAAHLLGLEVQRLRAALYALGGVLAGVGAVITNSWFLTARPDAGSGMELMSITIAVMGGTHIFGGEGRLPGTVLAILIVVTLQAGLQLANISGAWQLGVIGMLLIGSVVLNQVVIGRNTRMA